MGTLTVVRAGGTGSLPRTCSSGFVYVGAGPRAERRCSGLLINLLLVPPTDDIVGFSGDFGSGVGWEDEEEKETEEAGEEAEEEEGEAGEADDGGYIW